jgi:histidyl-tRNA synthetase
VLIEDETRRGAALRLVQQLRSDGLAVEYSLTALKPDKQFKRAVELGARFTAKAEGDTLRLKDLKTREEKTVPASEAAAVLSG